MNKIPNQHTPSFYKKIIESQKSISYKLFLIKDFQNKKNYDWKVSEIKINNQSSPYKIKINNQSSPYKKKINNQSSPYKKKEENIIKSPPRKFQKNLYLSLSKNKNEINIITFNVMATLYSRYNRKSYNHPEEIKDIEKRYQNIARILKWFMDKEIDFIFLQEVDSILYRILYLITDKESYKILFYNKSLKRKVYNIFSPSPCVIINRKKYKFITGKILYITPQFILDEDDIYATKKSRIAWNILTENKFNKKKIVVSTTHLSGQPDRHDIRQEELNFLVDSINKSYDFDHIIVTGDMNENNPSFFSNILKNYNLIHQNSYFKFLTATSFHKWNVDRNNNQFFKVPDIKIFETIDYVITDPNLKFKNHILFPHHKRGIFGIESPYLLDEDFLESKWVSDHALIYMAFYIN